MRIVRASKKPSTKAKRPVRAEEEIEVEDQVVDVDASAEDILFEAADVAELVAEVTGEEVQVEVDDEADEVIFTVGEEEFTVSPEGEELEEVASARKIANKRPVKASRKVARPARKVAAGRTLRRR